MTGTSTKSLPECSGPKLQPFEDEEATVDFKQLISESELPETSDGGHAHVFEVSIHAKTYALKIVRQRLFP